MIKILDYNCGNINAIRNAFNRLNINCELIKNLNDFEDASKIILPGVGSFDSAINKLNISGLRSKLEKYVVSKKIPILGICVGMQIFGKSSIEGKAPGLGWINYRIEKISEEDNSKPLPHMGWNQVKLNKKSIFYNQDFKNAYFYFLHSYCLNKIEEKDTITSECTYNNNFKAIVEHKNIYGIQFHPEKSHNSGLKILKSFSEL